jgi:succinate-semialdehyde dehydrogenase/glutarate-semialdehyde dehydrogenase
VCVSIERLYIHASIYDQFVKRFVERTQRLRLGATFDDTVHMGSMTTTHQLAVAQAHVEDAIAQGATVLTGGCPRPDLGPLFFAPTILANVRPGMKVYAEETFGPVVAVYPFTSVDDAIAQANDTCYGLNASVWSRRPHRARAVAAQIRAGSVNINEAYASSWTATASPIGGMKESGIGRRHGAEGILKYTEAQTITVQRWIPLAPFSAIAGMSYQTIMRRLLRIARYIPGIR